MDGNGGIVGIKNAGQSGRWGTRDVLLNRNDLRALLHRWPLISDANDIVGDLDLTNNGTVTFSADGASFNGSDQWLSGTLTKPNAWTMSAWVKPIDFAARRCAFLAGDPEGSAELIWGLGFSKHGAITDMSACMCSPLVITLTGEMSTANYPTTSMTLMAATYASGYLLLYRGATLIGTVGPISSPGTGSQDLSIGRMGANTDGYWYGTIADARLYSRALAADEIAILADNGPNP